MDFLSIWMKLVEKLEASMDKKLNLLDLVQ